METNLHVFLSSAVDSVSNFQTPVSLLLREEAPIHIREETDWLAFATGQGVVAWWRQISVPAGNWTPDDQTGSTHFTDWFVGDCCTEILLLGVFFIIAMGWDCFSETAVADWAHCPFPRWYVSEFWSSVEWCWQGKSEVLGEIACFSASLFVTDPTWTTLGANPYLHVRSQLLTARVMTRPLLVELWAVIANTMVLNRSAFQCYSLLASEYSFMRSYLTVSY